MKNSKHSRIIDKIEKIRSKNNVNWMDILRLSFKLDPKASAKIMKRLIMMIKEFHHYSKN